MENQNKPVKKRPTPEQLERIRKKHAAADEDFASFKIVSRAPRVPEGWNKKDQ
jgi:hypothetical protein